jgi:hypothetical protein
MFPMKEKSEIIKMISRNYLGSQWPNVINKNIMIKEKKKKKKKKKKFLSLFGDDSKGPLGGDARVFQTDS